MKRDWLLEVYAWWAGVTHIGNITLMWSCSPSTVISHVLVCKTVQLSPISLAYCIQVTCSLRVWPHSSFLEHIDHFQNQIPKILNTRLLWAITGLLCLLPRINPGRWIYNHAVLQYKHLYQYCALCETYEPNASRQVAELVSSPCSTFCHNSCLPPGNSLQESTLISSYVYFKINQTVVDDVVYW